MSSGEQLASWSQRPLTTNVYLGGFGIARALRGGPTSSSPDASLVLGADAWWWKWLRAAVSGAVLATLQMALTDPELVDDTACDQLVEQLLCLLGVPPDEARASWHTPRSRARSCLRPADPAAFHLSPSPRLVDAATPAALSLRPPGDVAPRDHRAFHWVSSMPSPGGPPALALVFFRSGHEALTRLQV